MQHLALLHNETDCVMHTIIAKPLYLGTVIHSFNLIFPLGLDYKQSAICLLDLGANKEEPANEACLIVLSGEPSCEVKIAAGDWRFKLECDNRQVESLAPCSTTFVVLL